MRIKVSKELLNKALQSNENLDCVEFEFSVDCIRYISDDEIEDIMDKHYYCNVLEQLIDNLSTYEKIKLIKDLKEQVGDNHTSDADFFLEFFNERFDYEQKQELIKKLVELNPSVEQAQKLVKTIKAHNESAKG
mgnify:CR=1 FL=1